MPAAGGGGGDEAGARRRGRPDTTAGSGSSRATAVYSAAGTVKTSKNCGVCVKHVIDFLAALLWQSALAARFCGKETHEMFSGPWRTLRQFARIRWGSAARNSGKIGDLSDKAHVRIGHVRPWKPIRASPVSSLPAPRLQLHDTLLSGRALYRVDQLVARHSEIEFHLESPHWCQSPVQQLYCWLGLSF